MSPQVSILMAAFNAQRYVRFAVDSVRAQSLKDWELIVVDDASTDGTWDILRAYAEMDARIHVFRQDTNQGQAVARNRALSVARGKFLCMLDADDWFSTDALEMAISQFATEGVDSVVFTLRSHYSDGREEDYAMPFLPGGVISGAEAFEKSMDWTVHGLYMVRRELHLRYPFDDRLRLYSDDNTSHLHYLHSRRVAFCQGVYYYRRHAESSTTAVSPQRFLHLEANWLLMQQLRQEGVGKHILDKYNRTRWHNYKALLRLYHVHGRTFTPQERDDVHALLCRMYKTFRRALPFPLFELRQWLGFSTSSFLRYFRIY